MQVLEFPVPAVRALGSGGLADMFKFLHQCHTNGCTGFMLVKGFASKVGVHCKIT